MKTKTNIPLTVPKIKRKEFLKNFALATKGTDNLFLFAGDQKVEHLNNDFVGVDIPIEVADPEHYFKIASGGEIGVFATQLGLLSKYAGDYRDVNYLVKLNSKTNIVPKKDEDPYSALWTDVDQVVALKEENNLNIVGVGFTLYLGSEYESEMLRAVANQIYKAHRAGLLFVLWIYPRGKAVKNEKDLHLIAGAAGVATCLGADFVKLNFPYVKGKKIDKDTLKKYQEVTVAAGKRTGVLCVGGSKQKEKVLLEDIEQQIKVSGTRGVAIGRNVYQRELSEAVKMTKAVSAICYHGKSAEEAYQIFKMK
jgi:fructose-bisphosphate aldolase / 6-deoxy-5-ketofructose 1-phosphate synthase